MWWKFPLVFLLGAPLAYRSWQEIVSHRGVEDPPVTLPSRDALAAKKTEQLKLAESAEVRQPPEDLAAAVFRGSVEPPRAALSRPKPYTELAAKIDAHLDEVARVRDFVETLVALDEDPMRQPRFREAPYAGWLDERRKEITPLVKKDADLQDRLRNLGDDLKGVLDKPTRSKVIESQTIAADLAEDADQLKAEAVRHLALRERAERKRVLAGAYRDVLGIALDEEKLLETLLAEDGARTAEARLKTDERRAKVLDHLGRYAALLKDGRLPAPEEVQKLVRSQAARFIARCVPDRVEEEDVVLFYENGAGGRSKPVGREEVWIAWAGKVPAFEKAVEYRKDYDFRPPEDKLVSYYFLKTGGQGYKVEATPYNRAARYFNDNRDRLTTLGEEAVRSFLNDASLQRVREESVPPAIARLRLLLEASEKHPGLFRSGPNTGLSRS
jgi:hypothetical protein